MERLSTLATFPLPRRSARNGCQSLAAAIVRLALSDAITPWLTEQTREDARCFLLAPLHEARTFWTAVLDVDDDIIVQHAQCVIDEHDAEGSRQNGDAAA